MYYRITCENDRGQFIGIYEYLKQYLFDTLDNAKDEWNKFLNSDCVTWLEKPVVYKNENKVYCSYFTEAGYSIFISKTFNEIKRKIITNKNYKIDIINIDEKNIVYKDEYQVVAEW